MPRRVAENPSGAGSSSRFTAVMKSHLQQFDSFCASVNHHLRGSVPIAAWAAGTVNGAQNAL